MNVHVFYFKLATYETKNDLLDLIKPSIVDQTFILISSISCQTHTDPTADGLAPAFNNMSTTTSCPPNDAL